MARKSLQDRIRQRKQSNFVGRESQLGLFRKTVQNPQIEEGDRCFDQLIFNIWGQGGVGKSTLLGQFQQIAESDFDWVDGDTSIDGADGICKNYSAEVSIGHAEYPRY